MTTRWFRQQRARSPWRRILSLEGPYGFGLKSIPMGDYAVEDGIIGSTAIPLTMIRTEFSLAKRDLAAYERDHLILDTTPVACAAMDAAAKEDRIIFSGISRASRGCSMRKAQAR